MSSYYDDLYFPSQEDLDAEEALRKEAEKRDEDAKALEQANWEKEHPHHLFFEILISVAIIAVIVGIVIIVL